MKTDILTLMREKRLFFDGGTGTCLQEKGLAPGVAPATLSLTCPAAVRALHAAYLDAGCDILKTNTFGVTKLGFPDYADMIRASVALAREAIGARKDKYVAFDIGPTGRLLEPLGDLAFEDAVSAFADAVRVAAEAGADLILIETMNDSYEAKAAVLAAKENAALPVFVTCAFDRTGKLMTGADVEAAASLLEGLGADAIGMNCSFGPDELRRLVPLFRRATSLPLIVNPNAGLPRALDGKTVYDISPERFASLMSEIAREGGAILGGCCGTTPEHLRAVVEAVRDIPLPSPEPVSRSTVSSYTHAVTVGEDPILIGERINPTGKPRLKEAIRAQDMEYLVGEALRQTDRGATVLDVNVGLPGIDEADMLCRAVKAVQAVTDAPLCLDSSSPDALAAAMRIYNGSPLVNSVTGKAESMDAILPLVKKYGGMVVVLTMDEGGIPDTPEGRVEIAERVAERALAYGIGRERLLIDPLALTISSGKDNAVTTLAAIRQLRARGFRVSLGVSNVSFGLPRRELINSTFFAAALSAGLSAAIMNPESDAMTDVYHAHRAIAGLDIACADYIRYADAKAQNLPRSHASDTTLTLRAAILQGRRQAAYDLSRAAAPEPLALIREEIVPALDEIGRAFEEGRAYLPQLLMSADAASSAFEAVKERLPVGAERRDQAVILATVHGDIHDIGKNIVRVLLESYGYKVHDLGKDVPIDAVVDAARKLKCRLVGLSALMTTTVPAMAETIAALKAADPEVRIMVGGAVLTAEYAAEINADFYAADAMDAVRYAERFYR